MLLNDLSSLMVEQKAVASLFLKRYVIVDFYLPKNISTPSVLSLLLINDGQSLDEMPFAPMLDALLATEQIQPLLCVGIHCNKDRRDEYGTAACLDYEGRGTKAKAYQQFLTEELLPFIYHEYAIAAFQKKGVAGFSMGGLSAIDTVWNHADIFSIAGIFSGSLWWRSRDLNNGYNDATDRIIHAQIREGDYQPHLRFYFTTGSLDETADRNNNGIIDSIDDTQDLIKELVNKGYNEHHDIYYSNDDAGRHDIPTWGKAMPGFLIWGWGTGSSNMLTGDDKNEEVME